MAESWKPWLSALLAASDKAAIVGSNGLLWIKSENIKTEKPVSNRADFLICRRNGSK
jgi:exosome complex RNA-binding protein Rrp4